MSNLNRVFLIGRCCRDPEIRYTPKGTAVAEVSLAINRVTKDENGEKKEEVTWIDCSLWSRMAEIAGQYLRKGSPVFIEGRLQKQEWLDKTTGDKRSKLCVIGENLQLLRSVNDDPSSVPPSRGPVSQRTAPARAPSVEPEDVPF
jgi:single-strand DNA-binding protein